MHEATIVMSILGIARRAMVDLPDALVSRIDVSVGKLRAVEPSLLDGCFAELSGGSVCEGATLVVSTIPITVRCRDCGHLSPIASFRFRCAGCNSASLDVVTGRELRVDRLIARPRPSRSTDAATDRAPSRERKKVR